MQQSRFGSISAITGAAALLAAIAVKEAEHLRDPRYGYLLNWMDRLGLINEPKPGQVPEWRAVGPLDLTDKSALILALACSACLALVALLIALWAEHKCEDSLNRSVGFILGVLALHIHGFQYSVPALLVGAIIHSVMKYRADA